jgi:hypothetical protein
VSGFSYSSSILASLEKSLSKERLARYLATAGGDIEKALLYHLWNAALGAALHMPIQNFELLLRNSLNAELSTAFGPAWYDALSPRLEPRLQQTIDAAKSELLKMHRPVNQSGLVAQFTFGFWLTLLTKRYDTPLWRTALYRAFPNAPAPLNRWHIHDSIAKIRELRNRIAHHEPIFQRNLEAEHDFVINVAGWMCQDTASWIRYHSQFKTVWKSPPK